METDLESVARAYRAVREAGHKHDPAFGPPMRAYLESHPEAADDLPTSRIVAVLIKEASVTGLLWSLKPGRRGGSPR